jgi:hypothetical protein
MWAHIQQLKVRVRPFVEFVTKHKLEKIALLGCGASILSFAERDERVLRWRLRSNMLNTTFRDTPNSSFSDLLDLEVRGEVPFPRPRLEQDIISEIQLCLQNKDGLIVGGAGGLGKSVFWENLLSKRPLLPSGELSNPWLGFEGPVRVINLLKCRSLVDFENQFVSVFHPKPWLPNLTLRPEPCFTSTLSLLESVLKTSPFPLIVYLEDINKMLSFSTDVDGSIATFFTTINENGGVVVGNSSVVMAYHHFQKLSHTGVRTHRYFFPAVPSSDPNLLAYASKGARLWANQASTPTRPDVSSKIGIWGGNLKMLQKEASERAAGFQQQVERRVSMSLTQLNTILKQHENLITDCCRKNEDYVLDLRRELLSKLAKDGSVRVDMLSKSMVKYQIAEQLCANDVTTFVREIGADGKCFEIVAPYYPCVITAFNEITKKNSDCV